MNADQALYRVCLKRQLARRGRPYWGCTDDLTLEKAASANEKKRARDVVDRTNDMPLTLTRSQSIDRAMYEILRKPRKSVRDRMKAAKRS